MTTPTKYTDCSSPKGNKIDKFYTPTSTKCPSTPSSPTTPYHYSVLKMISITLSKFRFSILNQFRKKEFIIGSKITV